MSIINDDNTEIRLPNMADHQKQKIFDFLQGAVYCHCNQRKNEQFHCRDLIGGENADWNGTPLQAIYEYRLGCNSPNPVDAAGQDAGWFLKEVLRRDSRKFEAADGDRSKCYIWVKP